MALNILIIGYGYVGQQLGKLLTTNTSYCVYATKRTYINQAYGAQMIFKPTMELTEDDFPDVDYVFYCASADTHEVESYQDTYVDELQHVLTLLTRKNQPPKHFIYTSSTSVYEVNDGSWVDENTEVSAQDPFAQMLLAGEQLVAQAPFPGTTVRFSGIYGPNRHPLLNKLMQGNANFCHSTRYSNRIHVIDCARALDHVMRIQDSEGLYIASDSEPTPINTIISWLSTKTGIPMPEARQHEALETEGGRGGNKRASNARLLATGFRLDYQNFHQGFQQILIDNKIISHEDHNSSAS